MSKYKGDIISGATIYETWYTNDAGGASINPTVNGTISVYKNDDVTQTVTGVTDVRAFDGLVGVHNVKIETTDAFYAVAKDYSVLLSAATIDGNVVNCVLFTFSIQNRNEQGDIIKIAGHSIIGTGTQVPDAFEKMFNVSKPVFTAESVNQNADVKPVTDIVSASKIAASMDAMSDIDFGAKMKVSLNAATPISVGKVTGNVDGSVDSVTKAVTTTSDTQIDNIETDTNELQGLISSSKLPAQVKGMDADVITASALKTDAVTEIVDAIVVTGVVGGGKLVNEGETLFGNVFFKNATQVDKYLGLYSDTDEPPETATLATITEPAVANGYARIKLENADWTESGTIKGQFTNLEKHFDASGGNIGPVTGYFICTTSSGTTGKLITVEHFSEAITIIDGGDPLYITPTQIVA